MKTLLRQVLLIALVAIGLSLNHADGAGAAPGASSLVVAGSGTISPGLTLMPGPQSVSFGGTGVGVGIAGTGTAEGVFTCSFSGSGVDSQISGSGTATGTCGGGTVGAASLNCNASYTRVGALVVITLLCGGAASGPAGSGSTAAATGAGVFVFVPTSAPGAPITAYSLVGAAAGAGIV